LSTLARLLTGLTPTQNEFTIPIGEDWLQGRTLYGGLSAALCVEAAIQSFQPLPPLRTAQIAFIGPSSPNARITPSILRRGKSTVFVAADLFGDAGIATRALLCFGAPRTSTVALAGTPPPQVPAPEDCPESNLRLGNTRPAFVKHFDIREAGSHDAEFLLWVKHNDETDVHPTVATVALADVPPPPSIRLLTTHAPVSSIAWSIDFLEERHPEDGPWCLIRSRAEFAEDGYSTQVMKLWSRTGRPLATGRQSVAVFA
jgi:acyl-CoA thioesterase